MGKGFTLAIYPWVYTAKYVSGDNWNEKYSEKPHKSPEEEAALKRAVFRENAESLFSASAPCGPSLLA